MNKQIWNSLPKNSHVDFWRRIMKCKMIMLDELKITCLISLHINVSKINLTVLWKENLNNSTNINKNYWAQKRFWLGTGTNVVGVKSVDWIPTLNLLLIIGSPTTIQIYTNNKKNYIKTARYGNKTWTVE